MTLTNVLATTEAVKTLKGMTFDPVKALEAMGYTYTETNSVILVLIQRILEM